MNDSTGYQPVVKLALCLVLMACRSTETGPVDGAALYMSKCSVCHGPEGKPNATMVQNIGVRDLTAPELRTRITPPFVAHQIRNGSQNKMMPPFAGGLSDAEISAIAAYVASPRFLAR